MAKDSLKYKVRFDLSFVKLALRNIAFPWIDGFAEIYKPHLVVSPQCGNEFISKGYKYFGFIEAKHFQIGLVGVVLLIIFSFLAALIWGAVK
jgi:hypothetical protein